MNVLVIDDQPDLVVGVVEELRLGGANVRIATNGLEGFRTLEESDFDVLVLDFLLPGLTGKEILYKIRETPHLSQVKIFLYIADGHISDKIKQEFIKLGARDVFEKPTQQKELLQSISKVKRVLTK